MYWISSNTSVRSTTAPGVTARSTPTSKASGSTIDGTRGGAGEVADEAPTALEQVAAAGVEAAFSTIGLSNGLLLGAEASTRLVDDEAHPLVVAPVELGVVDQAPQGLAERQVALQGALEDGVLRPRLLGEAAVLLVRLEPGTADAHLGQLGGQPQRAAGDAAGDGGRARR